MGTGRQIEARRKEEGLPRPARMEDEETRACGRQSVPPRDGMREGVAAAKQVSHQ